MLGPWCWRYSPSFCQNPAHPTTLQFKRTSTLASLYIGLLCGTDIFSAKFFFASRERNHMTQVKDEEEGSTILSSGVCALQNMSWWHHICFTFLWPSCVMYPATSAITQLSHIWAFLFLEKTNKRYKQKLTLMHQIIQSTNLSREYLWYATATIDD
jgi:hypothetical protein